VGAAKADGDDDKALDECDAVVAQGSDDDRRDPRARVPPARPFLGYGHGVARGDRPSIDPASAAQQLAPTSRLDGRGCPARVGARE
jgi:hypothetical protein